MPVHSIQLLPGLRCFRDTCNVYLIQDGDQAVAVDFGSGRWLRALPRFGIRKLAHVFLTHHHPDQCAGLLAKRTWPFPIHAPAGEANFLSPEKVTAYWKARCQSGPCPPSYSVLKRGVEGIQFDMGGFGDLFWGARRLRFIHTPGHGANALSIIITHHGKQIVFCGDAAHAGAAIWQPYHLEWDHWTGAGALAAWEGVLRLSNLGMDLLCPSHGPVVADQPRAMLKRLADKLLRFYRVKGHICAGETDDYLEPSFLECGARQVLPHLFQFGCNSYLLLSGAGESFVVDPYAADLSQVDALLKELGRPRITAAAATHYHSDHSDGLPLVKQKYGAKTWLHPWVALPLRKIEALKRPWLPLKPIRPDALWPERGVWRWNEYEFRIAPFPGQTRWHCAFMTCVDGRRVLFGGDNFQPSSRWNATGGFCAFNGSRFREGFMRSARLVLRWRPDLMATGHGTYYRFHASQFRKIIAWAERAESATRSLCPSGSLRRDYHLF
ncbi:MAG: MBL fold metallo-hydrolase [Verrucomicrobia bacterium]|nr:MBL fold metallo-hydrolase [Verrucomicrobiota bacterium]